MTRIKPRRNHVDELLDNIYFFRAAYRSWGPGLGPGPRPGPRSRMCTSCHASSLSQGRSVARVTLPYLVTLPRCRKDACFNGTLPLDNCHISTKAHCHNGPKAVLPRARRQEDIYISTYKWGSGPGALWKLVILHGRFRGPVDDLFCETS